jgi:nucleoid-associated protein YgaU
MAKPEKAILEVHWYGQPSQKIPVQYNPTEFTLDKGTQTAEITIPGLDSPLLQFVRGLNEKLTLDLFFDTTEDGMGAKATSVTTLTDTIYQLVKIESQRHAPPICTFHWSKHFPGSDISAPSLANQKRNAFPCIVESVRQKFTLFSSEGVPLRATLTVTLREYKTLNDQLHELNLLSPDHTQSHIVQHGETLSGLAGHYYQQPSEWRSIAEANDIEDPRRLMVGSFLTVPPLT